VPESSSPAATAANGPRHAAEPSLGQLVSEATTHLSTIVHSEIELAKLELRSSVRNAGAGVGLFIGAAAVLLFSLQFLFFALAEGLVAAGLSRWAAFLIVFGLQLIITAVCVYVGITRVKRVRAPERTLTTTKETVEYLTKSRG
jgi:hypothetical protein